VHFLHDIIIIGAGCAGLTAAVYACRAGKSVLVLEKETFGGQIAFAAEVENFPSIKRISGAAFANNLFEQATDAGAEIGLEDVLRVIDKGDTKTVVTEDGEHECKAVIIATGVTRGRLGVPREEELTGAGVSYCAVCDGAFFKGKSVAVAGGGNTALQDAAYLSELCEKVYLIHRRDSFRAEKRLVDAAAQKPNVEFILNSVVSGLVGGDALTGVLVTDNASKNSVTLPADGLFVAVGHVPNNGAFADLVELDGAGFIVAGENCKTSADGVFAAGDCRQKEVRQLTTAAADGAVAALQASGVRNY